jgi:hypothetical protein
MKDRRLGMTSGSEDYRRTKRGICCVPSWGNRTLYAVWTAHRALATRKQYPDSGSSHDSRTFRPYQVTSWLPRRLLVMNRVFSRPGNRRKEGRLNDEFRVLLGPYRDEVWTLSLHMEGAISPILLNRRGSETDCSIDRSTQYMFLFADNCRPDMHALPGLTSCRQRSPASSLSPWTLTTTNGKEGLGARGAIGMGVWVWAARAGEGGPKVWGRIKLVIRRLRSLRPTGGGSLSSVAC